MTYLGRNIELQEWRCGSYGEARMGMTFPYGETGDDKIVVALHHDLLALCVLSLDSWKPRLSKQFYDMLRSLNHTKSAQQNTTSKQQPSRNIITDTPQYTKLESYIIKGLQRCLPYGVLCKSSGIKDSCNCFLRGFPVRRCRDR